MSRYLVGIVLGTTHTVVAYVDGTDAGQPIQVLSLEQLVAPGDAVVVRPCRPVFDATYGPAPLARTS